MASFLVAATLASLALSSPVPNNGPVSNTTLLMERDPIISCETIILIERVEDGDPHQVWYDEQITPTLWCDPNGVNDCLEKYEKGLSVSISANLGATIAGWIDGGFPVSYTQSSTFGEECGSHEGGNVCVWYSTAFTAYTVQRWTTSSCGGTKAKLGDPYVLTSPNNNNAGGRGWYCVIGDCRDMNAGYWHDSVAGGPP